MQNSLIPRPKIITRRSGFSQNLSINESLVPAFRSEVGAYRLTVSKTGTMVEAAGEEGLFYARQTIAQIDRQFPARRPCMDIVDWPDFPVRGFYHDVSRGKVPTLATLLALAETCALHKLNHLQLYIEHTYAFKNHPEVWAGADPLTAAEIRKLDEHCAKLHIDLVPSFSTFGHFYTWIHNKFPDLNELDRDVSAEPFTYWDRQQHYTLDCRNPRSIALVREIIEEVRPLFRSRFFNICADETFDLGKGKNKKAAENQGGGRLYLDFVKKIMKVVRAAGAVPMFWGDIISKHPDLVLEIPKDVVFLSWEYGNDFSRQSKETQFLQKLKRPFYVCPGTSNWRTFLPAMRVAEKNIMGSALLGIKRGARGLLITDWGDYGHVSPLGLSLPGLLLGASCGWNSAGVKLPAFRRAVSTAIFGDPGGTLLDLLVRTSAVGRASWSMLCWSHQPRAFDHPNDWFDPATGLPNGLFKLPARTHWAALKKIRLLSREIECVLARCRPTDPLLLEEIRVALLGHELMEEITLVYYHQAGKTKIIPPNPSATATRVRELDKRMAAVWKKRNKPSELFRIRNILRSAASHLKSHQQPARQQLA